MFFYKISEFYGIVLLFFPLDVFLWKIRFETGLISGTFKIGKSGILF